MLIMDALKAAIRPDTILISVMFVNNEIGVIQDIPGIGAMCREKGIIFHVDAAQATGKVAIDMATLPVDLMSLASHKTYGPKGIGALYVRRKPRVRLEAQMHGGGHERGMRSGTLPTHQCLARPPDQWPERHGTGVFERPRHPARAAKHQHEFQLCRRRIADHGHQGSGGVVRFGLHLGQPGAQLCAACLGPQRRVCPQQLAHDDWPLDTEAEIDEAIATIRLNVGKLRELSPLWEMYKDGIDLSTIQWAAH